MPHPGSEVPIPHAERIRRTAESSAPGRSAVAASWRRSLLHHHLDPQSAERRPRLESHPIRERREQSEMLLRAAGPALERLASVALDTGSAVLLADAGGVILEGRVRAADDAVFDLAGLAVGTDWSEPSEGTNGIGTCLADGRAVTIWRDQHFFARNLPLVCIGAPVEAADGSAAGVINISCCREDMSEVQARLMAIAVQDAAVTAAAALFHASFPGARVITLGSGTGHVPALLAVDGDDLLLGANRAARRMLQLGAEDMAARPPLADLLDQTGAARPDLARALRAEVMRALTRAGGNVTLAAQELGIGRATLYRKMKDLDLPRRRTVPADRG